MRLTGRSTTLVVAVALAACSAAPGFVHPGAAQAPGAYPPADGPTPRIGLVLSGGGTRGAAHVGVLKVLEEYRVPIHAIVGTSVGAIVGAMYAAGQTPLEIEAALEATDWPAMLTDRLPRRYLSFRRKEEDRAFLGEVELEVHRRGVRLPSGVVLGYNVEARLTRLLLPAAGVRNFDDLAVPFRAVATDLATGDMVVLRQGDLASAVRASFSIPGAFTPVLLDGRLLVDGGLVRNLPVDVAREMGVDLIIAVDVETRPAGSDRLKSLLDVSRQITGMVTRINSEPQAASLGEDDVLIRPELGTLGNLEFHRWREASDAGAAAARALEERLRALSRPEAEFRDDLDDRRRPLLRPIVVDSVRLAGVPGVPEEVMRRLLRVRPGEELDPAELEAGLLRLHGLGLFQRIHTRVDRSGPMSTLVIEPEPHPSGTHPLRIALTLEEDQGGGGSSYSVLSGLWLRGLNSRGAEARVDLQVGEPRRAMVEYFQPVASGSPVFLAARATYGEGRAHFLTATGQPPTPYQARRGDLAVEIGTHVGGSMELRAGVFLRRHGGAPDGPGEVTIQEMVRSEAGLAATFTLDRLDNAAFPHRGSLARISWSASRDALGGTVSYDRLDAALVQAIPAGRNTLIFAGEVSARSRGAPAHDPYLLGGALRLTGRAAGSVAGDRGGLARVTWLHALGGGDVHLGVSFEVGGAWGVEETVKAGDVIPAVSLLLGIRTLVGPIYVALGHARDGSPTAYLSIGRSVAAPW